MKTKTSFAIVLGILLCVIFAGIISACDYDDDEGCDFKGKTYVKGIITFADDGKEAKNADITVTCIHNGTEYTETTHSKSGKHNKGTYFVIFHKSECVKGDEVIVSASKDGMTGENKGIVEDWFEINCLDVDIARINVPLVPEFTGIIAGLTIMGALGVFFVVRKKDN